MKKHYIDFAPPSWYRRWYQISPLNLALLVLALLWLGAVFLQQNQIQQSLQQQNAELAKLQNRLQARAEVKAPVVASNIEPLQAKAVNLAINQLNLPWRDLLQALEQATPKEIALLALEPDAKSSTLRVQAESKSSLEMAAYLKKLRRVGMFDNVVLTRHEINEQDPNHPLRFQFEAHWVAERGAP